MWKIAGFGGGSRGGGSITLANAWVDGSLGAPTGTPQHPNLLDSYHPVGQSNGRNKSNGYQPPFNVPGVDYRVGINTGVTLKDPATISDPGLSVDTTNKVITTIGNNVTLDGYDFGPYTIVHAAGFSGLTILNSKWVSTGAHPIDQRGDNLIMRYCDIDAGGFDMNQGLFTGYSGTNCTIEWCVLGNVGVDLISTQGSHQGALTLRFNLLHDNAVLGGHPDITQLAAGPYSPCTFWNNLCYTPSHSTQGLGTDIGVLDGNTSQNVFVGLYSNALSVINPTLGLTGTYTTANNYFDGSTAAQFCAINAGAGFPGDAWPQTIFTNNIDMTTGLDQGP